MSAPETALAFVCQEQTLVGILHHSNSSAKVGVLVVVGGPQYRVGSHRQFVSLARTLANNGVPVFRFDCRGMGDSEGRFISFEAIGADIKAAIDEFMRQSPGLEQVVIWGLCDGASAACFYGAGDERVNGLVLVNPWVRTEQGEAKAYIKHYYLSRILSRAFWQKVFSGQFDLTSSIKSLRNLLQRSAAKPSDEQQSSKRVDSQQDIALQAQALPERVFDGLRKFQGRVLLVISGRDLTAAEFLDAANQNKKRKRLLEAKQITRFDLPDADHTFSSQNWKKAVSEKTLEWLRSL